MRDGTPVPLGKLRCALFVLTAFGWLVSGSAGVGAVTWPECDQVCSTASCEDTCYVDQVAFDNGNAISCMSYGVYDFDQECCGDGLCQVDAGESHSNCSIDCGPVGHACNNDDVCDLGENCVNCPSETCGMSPSCNLNGVCESGEDKYCDDCKVNGFCTRDSDCDSQGSAWGYTYVCINDYCMIEETTGTPCDADADCDYMNVGICMFSSINYPYYWGVCVDLITPTI